MVIKQSFTYNESIIIRERIKSKENRRISESDDLWITTNEMKCNRNW